MIKVAQGPPIGKSVKINVALQRPSLNIKEAENQGLQAAAAARNAEPMTFAKHGTYFTTPSHDHLSSVFDDDKD